MWRWGVAFKWALALALPLDVLADQGSSLLAWAQLCDAQLADPANTNLPWVAVRAGAPAFVYC